MIVCRARLSWRSPPRSSRWRTTFPELAGIGAAPASRARPPRSGAGRGRPGDQDCCGADRADARSGEQLRGRVFDAPSELALELPASLPSCLTRSAASAARAPAPSALSRFGRAQTHAGRRAPSSQYPSSRSRSSGGEITIRPEARSGPRCRRGRHPRGRQAAPAAPGSRAQAGARRPGLQAPAGRPARHQARPTSSRPRLPSRDGRSTSSTCSPRPRGNGPARLRSSRSPPAPRHDGPAPVDARAATPAGSPPARRDRHAADLSASVPRLDQRKRVRLGVGVDTDHETRPRLQP